ncbi:MAG: DNA-3-methyladenine glycosylase [Acidimicrobiales bacterium]
MSQPLNRRLGRAFFDRDPLEVAPDLLGKVVLAGERSGSIVEVEAYRGSDDPGSHGYRGVTPRTEVMFGPPGHLYVYFSYGMHWCANVVCGPPGVCGAVLIRGLSPLTGLAGMYTARPKAKRDRDLCSGPAKLCASLGIDGRHNGINLMGSQPPVEVRDRGVEVRDAAVSTRIGLGEGKGQELPWRFYVAGDPNVSARPR